VALQLQQHAGDPVSIHDLTHVKSAGLEDLLVYDRHGRMLFIDHFLGEAATLDELARGTYEERGDFASGVYQVVDSSADGKVEVTLRRRGRVGGAEVEVQKRVTLEGTTVSCNYRITSAQPLTLNFVPELALILLAGDALDRYYRVPGQTLEDRRLASRGETAPGAALELVNEWDKFLVRVSASPEAPLWRFPVETASQSEGGFERTYQASVLVPVWRAVTVDESAPFEARVTVEMIEI
jgi:alpha-amylase